MNRFQIPSVTLGTLAVIALVGFVSVYSYPGNPRTLTAAISGSGSGLVAYYTFEDPIGTIATDSSGNGNSATLKNGATFGSGRIGSKGVSLDGVNDHVIIENTAVVQTGDLTFCSWFYAKPSSPSRFTSLVNNTQFSVGVDTFNDPSILLGVSNNAGSSNAYSGTLTTDEWHHVCVSRNGSAATIYLDGELSGAANQTAGPANATPFQTAIGQYSTINSNNFFGYVDEVRIYDRPLTSSEIGEIYDADLGNTSSDTIPPSISAIQSSVGPTSATITWTTNEISDSQIEYGTSASYGTLSSVDLNKTKTHSYTLAGLQSQTTYHYKVRSKDSAGNQAVSAAGTTFTTGAPPGTTITAASCSQADVQAAIDSAPDEGIVKIPAGTCTWTKQVVADLEKPIPRSLSIEGAGMGQTIILDGNRNNDWIGALVGLVTAADKYARITGLTFRSSPTIADMGSKNSAIMNVGGSSHKVRIDHIDFDTTLGGMRALFMTNYVWGVIDNNKFGTGVGQAVAVFHDTWPPASTPNQGSWASPLSLGSEQAIFIEDNDFKNTLVSDGWRGARYVIRHNNVETKVVPMQNHGGESGNYVRSAFSMEVYNNNVKLPEGQYLFYIRGGTALFHNNTITGYDSGHLGNFINFRSWDTAGEGGTCDGTGPYDLNDGVVYDSGTHTGARMVETVPQPAMLTTNKNWTTNQWVGYSVRNVTKGWGSEVKSNTGNTIISAPSAHIGNSRMPSHTWDTGDAFQILRADSCFDQVGRGQGVLLSGGPVDFGGTGMKPTGWMNQKIEPVYSWSNTINGEIENTMSPHAYVIKKGRDYFEGACRPGYTPYTYPHPLRNEPAQSQPLNCPGTPQVQSYTLTVTKTGNGTVSGVGISCGADCTHLGSGSVTLIATPSAGATFSGWSGGGCSGTGVCTINLSSNLFVEAAFSAGTADPSPSPTTSLVNDTTAPGVFSIAASLITTTSATITWTTNEPATTRIEYGLTSAYGSAIQLVSDLTINHTLQLQGLTPNTLYHYRVVSRDEAGNSTNSAPGQFSTLSYATQITPAVNNPPSNTPGINSGGGGGGTSATTTLGISNAIPCTPSSASPLTRTLQLGSTGADVKLLQQFLNQRGFTVSTTGGGSPGLETTYFGPKLKAAVIRFQSANSITPASGIVGPLTRNKIAQLRGTTNTCVPTNSSPVVASGGGWTRTLQLGSTGADVKALQQFLNKKGFTVSTTGAGSAGLETTYFGPKMKAALIKFQLANNIAPASGIFGPITRGRVNSMR